MRYAIYFTPPADDPLTRKAAHWLGRDAFDGAAIAQPSSEHFGQQALAELTADPRRYGFHGTLKAPFMLAEGKTEAELVEALDLLASDLPAFTLPQIVLGRLGPFFALVPAEWSAELQLLCDTAVMRLESFRAPLNEADIARRQPEKLSESQRENLRTWGYPYVFEDFRFHMTLTGPVPPEQQPFMQQELDRHFAGHANEPLEFSQLALFIEPERGAPFLVRHVAKLAEPKLRKTA
ncbi:DUF1045 domain-containing protein [Rhizobium alvei]|uniref:DUF1045 domain-containing protein n=1 Tax=Rhizobium alvei TaxID=1132659 RepID=A0ABT8YR02_9HYPH|nr:DUF1045 domain-containing protein [Rhizobium alvei]MDO6965768.1 DUF1045 domain-containing protein [Rhizobium alvei]